MQTKPNINLGVLRVASWASAGVPITFDFHHHRFCTGDMTEEQAFKAAIATWPKGVRPQVLNVTCHYICFGAATLPVKLQCLTWMQHICNGIDFPKGVCPLFAFQTTNRRNLWQSRKA